MPNSLRSRASAIVDLPAPGKPVSHRTRGLWPLSTARASRSTVNAWGTPLGARPSGGQAVERQDARSLALEHGARVPIDGECMGYDVVGAPQCVAHQPRGHGV